MGKYAYAKLLTQVVAKPSDEFMHGPLVLARGERKTHYQGIGLPLLD